MKNIVNEAKKELLKVIKNYGVDPYNLTIHIDEMEKWGRYMCLKYPDANQEIIMLAIYFHDSGHYPIDIDNDHAVVSEERARQFLLSFDYPKEQMNEVLHCIRAHRCKDVLPQTLEARITAFIDTISHMTDYMYYRIAKDYNSGKTFMNVYDKMDRDLRDLSIFPEIRDEVLGLLDAWKNLIKEYDKVYNLRKMHIK